MRRQTSGIVSMLKSISQPIETLRHAGALVLLSSAMVVTVLVLLVDPRIRRLERPGSRRRA
jgi:hypothetical protein